MTSPVESVNSHMKNTSKANEVEGILKFLLQLVTSDKSYS
jgi:hypothetical protein